MNMINELDLMETHWNNYKQDYTTEEIILASHLGVDIDDAESYINDDDYLVLTDEEADEAVREEIEQLVWAFNPSFLCAHTNVSEEAIKKIQELHEDANDALAEMIKDFDEFVEDAVASDGRGHFLAGYDHEENEVRYLSVVRDGLCYKTKETYYYIYRRN
tara:strand:+ start:1361 stop:1843 length:483 start_codon:yes stop_codon:yes gene_type:complete